MEETVGKVEKDETKAMEIAVDSVTHITIKTQEFDKKIAEAKAVVADLEKQKAIFIYDANVQILVEKANADKLKKEQNNAAHN